MSGASNRGSVQQAVRIVDGALEHVRYHKADGYTPSTVQEAWATIQAQLGAPPLNPSHRCGFWPSFWRGFFTKWNEILP
jgi:hypothetical protein